MKPLNAKDSSCDPISSNCVIWQGPDINCIKLCKGDTVSDIVNKLATELCTVLEILNINTYSDELACFNLTTCGPKDFETLIQFILTRLCSVEKCSGCVPDCNGNPPAKSSGGSSTAGRGVTTNNPTINLAPCFYYTNQMGDEVTTMPLLDYVVAIGNKMCTLVSQITIIQNQIINLDQRVTVLENTPPPTFSIPEITPNCVLPATFTPIDQVLTALETQYCQLLSATGSPTAIYQNIVKQCSGLNNAEALSGTGAIMSSLPGWSSTVSSLAQAFGNMWLTICDMRNAIKNIQLNCCPSGCNGVELSLTAILTGGELNVYINGTIPPGFLQCSALGTVVQITDTTGNMLSVTMDLLGYLNNPTGFPISLSTTPINISENLNIVIQPCLINGSTDTTCQSYLSYLVVNSALCPVILFIPEQTQLNYSFTSNPGSYTYNIQLWNSAGSVMISNQVRVVSSVIGITGTFTSLTAGTTYLIRVVIQPTSCISCDPTVCSFNIIQTNPAPCYSPISVTAEINIL